MLKDQLTTRGYKSYRLFRVVFVGLALLTVIVLASVIPELTAMEVRKKLNNALNLEQDLGELLTLTQDAESGQRGYLLTGDSEYLKPYLVAKSRYDPVLNKISREILRDTVQQARVERVRDQIDNKFAELSTSITLLKRGDTLALNGLLRTNRGLNAMDSIRYVVGLLRETEVRDIRVRQAQLAQLSTITTILRFIGVLGVGLVFYYIYTQLRPLFETITDSNHRLKEENLERRRVEEKNRDLIESLNAKNRELDQFAYIASHDLREPLRTVSNYIEVLSEDHGDRLPADGQEYLATIHRATERMEALIDTLLLYSRIGRSEDAVRVPLRQSVTEALENLALRVEESNAKITLGDLPSVEGYPVALRQLFQNLLANALKFHQPGQPPRVEIRGECMRNRVRVYIKDHGIGMNKADQEKVFELFTRLENSQIQEGEGIGLAFCQKIVQLHQGTIVVESDPGLGCTFIVTIPRSLSHEEARVHYVD